MALLTAFPAKRHCRKPVGFELHTPAKPRVRRWFQSRADEYIDSLGGVRRVHLFATTQTLSAL